METTDSTQNDSSMNLAPKQKSKLKGGSAASGNLYPYFLIDFCEQNTESYSSLYTLSITAEQSTVCQKTLPVFKTKQKTKNLCQPPDVISLDMHTTHLMCKKNRLLSTI